jgi:hypothetical protein
MFIINWLKKLGAKKLIKSLDELEPYLAEKIREAQQKLNNVPPNEFAKGLVDDIQRQLCAKFGVDPKDIGLNA